MSSSRVLCFLNSPYLGGAERSFIIQAADLKRTKSNYDIHLYVPYFLQIDEASNLKDFIVENGFRTNQISYYCYSSTLYNLSRAHGFGILLWLPQVVWGMLTTIKNLSRLNLSNPNIWWVGGNKVGFVVYLLGIIAGFKGRLLWHFRDYPYAKGFFKIIWQLFRLPHRFDLEAIGNSYDVSKHISLFKKYFKKVHTLYNPVGKIPFRLSQDQSLVLGTASMMAPWKGVHSLALFAEIYETELKELGFKNFYIYGDEIYKTKGKHVGYKRSVEKLVRKFDDSFVVFKGMASPEDIFSELDIFIHGSLAPEPFGRVILEAYNGGSALISTGLGGSRELIEPGETGLLFLPYDYQGLFECVKRLSGEERFRFTQNAKEKAQDLKEKYFQQLELIF
ncbi:MAG: glycosyltransferase family 4 protein [Bacteriovoracaceae bacterium]|nr:glycosyltransferase family 4 protein [Bacteriovoracaceae bacterium]